LSLQSHLDPFLGANGHGENSSDLGWLVAILQNWWEKKESKCIGRKWFDSTNPISNIHEPLANNAYEREVKQVENVSHLCASHTPRNPLSSWPLKGLQCSRKLERSQMYVRVLWENWVAGNAYVSKVTLNRESMLRWG
jgi:hypothetical protein